MKKFIALSVILALILGLLAGSLCCTATTPQHYQDGYYYTVVDGEATLVNRDGSCTPVGDYSIPETLGGYPVTRIGKPGLGHFSNITSLTLPEGIVAVEGYSFRDCPKLKKIVLPSTLTEINSLAFTQNPLLEEITMAAGNPRYHTGGNCLIETATGKIYAGAAKSVIPTDGSVTSIEGHAFQSLTGLKSITIPKSLTSIHQSAFNGCSGLAEIKVEEGHTVYHADKNCLIDTASGTVVIGNSAGEIPTDPNVHSIGQYAFYGRTEIQKLLIPANIQFVYDCAFQDCSSLKQLTVLGAEVAIGLQAFADTPAFTLYCDRLNQKTYRNGNFEKCTKVFFCTTHTWDAGVVTTPASLTETGIRTHSCTVCTMPITSVEPKITAPPVDLPLDPFPEDDTPTNPPVNPPAKPSTTPAQIARIFSDLSPTDWYVKNGAIGFVYDNNLFNGVTKSTFAPNTQMNRAMFVTVLGRLAGVKVNNNTTTPFVDVGKDYYTGYVKWANEKGIVNGTDKTHFSPLSPVTREQICAIFLRYCDYADIALKKTDAKISFADADEISSYAKKAVSACQQAGLVSGEKWGSGYRFRPKGSATRAEVATIIMNFAKNYKN